jgi:site-specific recombinase XerC
LQERGLSPLTLLNYIPVVEQFLSERFHNGAPDFATLRAPHVTGFVMRHAHQLSPVRARLMVTALRSFFRYLRHRGAIATDLAGCIPAVPNWSLSTLPRFLPAATVERILECCDRTTSVGRRNHAILLLLARLGVRAGEVVGLNLDDIDWSTGQITIRGKGGKSAQLPLAADVGEALASYLRHDPPAVGRSQSVPSPPGSVSRFCELVDDFLAGHACSETCRCRVAAHWRPCVSTLPSHEPASAGRLAG